MIQCISDHEFELELLPPLLLNSSFLLLDGQLLFVYFLLLLLLLLFLLLLFSPGFLFEQFFQFLLLQLLDALHAKESLGLLGRSFDYVHADLLLLTQFHEVLVGLALKGRD